MVFLDEDGQKIIAALGAKRKKTTCPVRDERGVTKPATMGGTMMRLWINLLLVLAAAAALASVPQWAHAGELQAGLAVVDITPPVPYRMCGYFNERLSTGIHDPLHAKALVL